MWRILGKRPDGQSVYVTIDTTADNEVAVHTPGNDPVRLTPTRATRLWLALGQAIQRVTHMSR